MTSWPRRAVGLGLIAVGAAIALAWVASIDPRRLSEASQRIRLFWLAPIVLSTLSAVGIRFLRWQFLLRRAGVRVPIRPSLLYYAASLVGIATPMYLGELVRAGYLRQRHRVPVGATASLVLLERILDVLALLLLSTIGLLGWIPLGVGLMVLSAIGCAKSSDGAEPMPADRNWVGPRMSATALAAALAMTIASWGVAGLSLAFAALALAAPLPTTQALAVYASGTLFGALSLMPAGIGVTGSAMILELSALGVAEASAILIVSLVRLLGVWLAVAIGALATLWLVALNWRGVVPESADHFDAIQGEYADQFSPHVWDYLLERKTKLIADAIGGPKETMVGLDLGCGLGRQMGVLRERGYRVVGVDMSVQLLRHARRGGEPVIAADALALPFPTGTFDYVYTVGVLHHVPGFPKQSLAIAEIQRVLKPGGRLIVHETNPRNPLFRFYMGYLFPLLRSIDEGIECWIDPATWAGVQGLRLERTVYFTFLPDFLPRWMMAPVVRLERWLERSRFRSFSAHYCAVLTRANASAPSDGESHATSPGTQRSKGVISMGSLA